jgi:hypothetical protein
MDNQVKKTSRTHGSDHICFVIDPIRRGGDVWHFATVNLEQTKRVFVASYHKIGNGPIDNDWPGLFMNNCYIHNDRRLLRA